MLDFWVTCFLIIILSFFLVKSFNNNNDKTIFYFILIFIGLLILLAILKLKDIREISPIQYEEIINSKESCIKYKICKDILLNILEDNKIKKYEYDDFFYILEKEIENEKKEKMNIETFEKIKRELKELK